MVGLDRLDHPDFVTATNFSDTAFPACLGPLAYGDRAASRPATSPISAPRRR